MIHRPARMTSFRWTRISFPGSQQDIYLGLQPGHRLAYDEVPWPHRCFKETAELAGAHTAVAQDRLIMSTNDQSGYFVLPRPATGWTAGLYRCGLFAQAKKRRPIPRLMRCGSVSSNPRGLRNRQP